MMIVYGFGTISGPLMVGPIMDRFGPRALFFVMAVYFLLYATYAAWRIRRREENDGLVTKTDYQAMSAQPLGADAAAAGLQPDAPSEERVEDTTTPDWR
jgi:MFS family permease